MLFYAPVSTLILNFCEGAFLHIQIEFSCKRLKSLEAVTQLQIEKPDEALAKPKRKWLSVGIEAHGRIAIGVSAHGFVALGVSTHGIISIGVVSMGVFSVGLVSMGVLTAGLVSMGLMGVGPQTMQLLEHHHHSTELEEKDESRSRLAKPRVSDSSVAN